MSLEKAGFGRGMPPTYNRDREAQHRRQRQGDTKNLHTYIHTYNQGEHITRDAWDGMTPKGDGDREVTQPPPHT